MAEHWRWEHPRQVTRELKGLNLRRADYTKIAAAMDRFANGRVMPNDHKKLRDGVEELRVSIYKGKVRLYFARIDGRCVLLALHVHVKKKQNDREAVDLAVHRLRMHADGCWP